MEDITVNLLYNQYNGVKVTCQQYFKLWLDSLHIKITDFTDVTSLNVKVIVSLFNQTQITQGYFFKLYLGYKFKKLSHWILCY